MQPSTKDSMEQVKEIKVHEHGFVRLVEVNGSDQLIEDAARLSYGGGTRKLSETRGLLRYLMKHSHTSPFEMAGAVFHIKLPVFVMRQWVRHRTASLNELSARYSELPNECYIPAPDYVAMQSTTNKQGRTEDGGYTEEETQALLEVIDTVNETSMEVYAKLLEANLSRELARIITPVSVYTECYWKMDLHNLFHFLKLRTDSHAQREIRDYADAVLELITPEFPLSVEAWKDYSKDAKVLSALDQKMLVEYCRRQEAGMDLNYTPADFGMSQREFQEMNSWLAKMFPRVEATE